MNENKTAKYQKHMRHSESSAEEKKKKNNYSYKCLH